MANEATIAGPHPLALEIDRYLVVLLPDDAELPAALWPHVLQERELDGWCWYVCLPPPGLALDGVPERNELDFSSEPASA